MQAKSTVRSIMEIVSFLLLLANAVMFCFAETRLVSEGVPGIRFTLCFLMAFIFYGLLFILKRFPHIMLYPVKLTAENIEYQMRIASLALSVVTFFVLALITTVMYGLIKNTLHPGFSLLPIEAGLGGGILLTIVIYLIAARRRA